MDSVYPVSAHPLRAGYAPVAADIVIFSLPQDSSGGVYLPTYPTGITDIRVRRRWHVDRLGAYRRGNAQCRIYLFPSFLSFFLFLPSVIPRVISRS